MQFDDTRWYKGWVIERGGSGTQQHVDVLFDDGAVEREIPLFIRVRFHIIRNARIDNVGKYQSCMVSKVWIIWKQTVAVGSSLALFGTTSTNTELLSLENDRLEVSDVCIC